MQTVLHIILIWLLSLLALITILIYESTGSARWILIFKRFIKKTRSGNMKVAKRTNGKKNFKTSFLLWRNILKA